MSGDDDTVVNFQAERAARGGTAKLATLLELSIKNAQGDQRRAAKESARENAQSEEVTTKDVPMEQTTSLARVSSANFSITISSFDEAMRVAQTLARSTFVPESFRGDEGAVFAAMMMASELNIGIMQGLQGIAVIKGRPSVWGDLALALCQRHPDFDGHTEELNEAGTAAKCTMKRRGRPDVVRYFSLQDAEAAGLLRKEGPWQTARKRMLQMRARAFAMRDQFSDALRGLYVREETEDYVLPGSSQADGSAVVTPSTVTKAAAVVATVTPPPAAPPPVAAVVIPAPSEAADFVIRDGKNKGRKLRDLVDEAVEWYAGCCKDEPTRAAASVVWDQRRMMRAMASAAAATNHNTDHIDADGVVTNGTMQ